MQEKPKAETRTSPGQDWLEYSEIAKRLVRQRRAIQDMLPLCVGGDVPWDVLVYLYAHRSSPDVCTVGAIASALRISEGVLARWLKVLCREGLTSSAADPQTTRWHLSQHGVWKLSNYFREQFA